MGTNIIRAILLASVSVASAVAVPAQAFAQEAAYQVDIPAQSLGDALRSLGRLTRQNIVFDGSLVRGKKSVAIRGRMTSGEALSKMLAGSGLVIARGAGGTLMVKAGNGGTAGSTEVAGSSGAAVAPAENEEIVVTGSHIRGVKNESAPALSFDRAEIESGGFSTAQDFFDSVPQIFGGGASGASEDGLMGEGAARVTNFTSAAGVNLRGLGTNSTLVLLNGRRMAPSQFGQTVDISLLPLSAVEGVELLTDGASALYGSDAIAGVINIRLRSDFEGAETRLRFGDSTTGGRSEWTASQAFGHRWNTGSLLLSGQYQHLDSLRSDQREATQNKPAPTDVLPATETYSLVATARQTLGGGIELFGQGFYANKSIDRRNRDASIAESSAARTENLSLAAGLTAPLWGNWKGALTLSYGRDTGRNRSDQLNLRTNVSTIYAQQTRFEAKGAELIFDGSLFALPAGDARAALGASYRDERFRQMAFIGGIQQPVRTAGFDDKAVFGELFLPLISPDLTVPALRRLELSLALRHDDYSAFGSTTNPRAGLVYEPFRSLRLRASYSRSFRAPNASEQLTSAFATTILGYPFAAPSGTGTVPAFYVSGSRGIGPEKAESFAWGFDFEPGFLPGFTLTFNRYHIAFKDRIVYPPFDLNAFRQPQVYGQLIGAFANDAEAQAFLDGLVAAGGTFFDFNGGGSQGVRYYFDGRQLNAARVDQSGFDISATQRVALGTGNLTLRANVAYIDKIKTRLAQGAVATDLVDTYGNPPKFRLRADAGWSNERMVLNVGLNHVGRYIDRTLLAPAPVAAWTTFDGTARFNVGDLIGRPLDILQIGLSAQNLFNKAPPFVAAHTATSVNYDPANASPLGRFIAADLMIRW